MRPAVSIITPTHNHARYIAECLKSVRGQTREDWEQVVIDDGSTDGTGDVVRSLADPRLRYVRQEQLGLDRLAETYNRALAMTTAPLVAILEGDDWWPADKLATLVPAFGDPQVVLAYGDAEVMGGGLQYPARVPEPSIPGDVRANAPIGRAALGMLDARRQLFTFACTVVLRRATLDRMGGFQRSPGLPATDLPTFLRFALEGRFHYEPRTMGYWRVHGANTTLIRGEGLVRGALAEMRRFREEHAARLPLSRADWDGIERSWRESEGALALTEGRRLMLRGRWSDARREMLRAVGCARPALKAAGIAGFALSWLGVPLEAIYRGIGRRWLRRTPDGRFETRVGR